MAATLITGGTGFIGSRLALQSLEAGDDVRVLAMLNTEAERENAKELEAAGIRVVEGSITDPASLAPSLDGVDVVYHLAAAQHEANVPDEYFHRVNVGGTRHLLEAAADAGVARFVHGSTIGVYGEEAGRPVSEDTPLEPDNIYGVTKLAGERVVSEFADRLPVVICRISETYGPGDRRLLKLFRAVEKGRLFRIGPGTNLHHVVYIDDLVEGLRLMAGSDAAVGSTVVLAGPEPVTSDDMITAVSVAMGASPPRLRVPLWPFLAGAAVMEAVLRPMGIQPPLHRRRMNFFLKSFSFRMSVARDLGYDPGTSFEDGARETAAWYRAEGLL